MPAPDYTAEIQQLMAGLASGEVTIESGGDRITYRGVDDIEKALKIFRSLAAEATGRGGRYGFSVAQFSKE